LAQAVLQTVMLQLLSGVQLGAIQVLLSPNRMDWQTVRELNNRLAHGGGYPV